MILQENYTLNNGVAIPKLGLGTWFIADVNAESVVKSFLSRRSLRQKQKITRQPPLLLRVLFRRLAWITLT